MQGGDREGHVGGCGRGERGMGWKNHFRRSVMCWCTGSSAGGVWGANREAVRTIRFGLLNICNGQNGRLESMMRGILQANVDLGVSQETKVTNGIYMKG